MTKTINGNGFSIMRVSENEIHIVQSPVHYIILEPAQAMDLLSTLERITTRTKGFDEF